MYVWKEINELKTFFIKSISFILYLRYNFTLYIDKW